MKLIQIICLAIVLSVLFAGCKGDKEKKELNGKRNSQQVKSPGWYKNLIGTWVNHDSASFTFFEITDTSNVIYISYTARDKRFKNPDESHWYYKSKAKMSYFGLHLQDSQIYIKTNKFRFDYLMRKDTLIEIDKGGIQDTFLKMKEVEPPKKWQGLTEEEKRIGFDETN